VKIIQSFDKRGRFSQLDIPQPVYTMAHSLLRRAWISASPECSQQMANLITLPLASEKTPMPRLPIEPVTDRGRA
jgi:hypothetical protein